MKKKNIGKFLYIIIFFMILLLPLGAMSFYQNDAAKEKRIPAPFPKLQKADKWNQDYLSQLGDYFADHFAFRTEFIQANAIVENKVFGMSGEDSVIQGEEGYLFYEDSLDSYLGKEILDSRERYGIVRTLELIREYTEANGTDFVFTVAPNKNSLYPQFMPYYYRKISEESDLDRLARELEQRDLPYADLKAAFRQEPEILYHKLDSHWNNKGAVLAMTVILDELGQEYEDYEQVTYEEREDFAGDLYAMQFPLGNKKDQNIYYHKEFDFSYGKSFKEVDDISIYTENPGKEKSAVVFRDSFGNSLMPYLADEFGRAFFSRATPYQVDAIEREGADVLIFEIVERHLDILAAEVPVMPAPERQNDFDSEGENGRIEEVEISEEDDYLKIAGNMAADLIDTDSPVYLRCHLGDQERVYEAFPLNGEEEQYGFGLYMPMEHFEPGTYQFEVLIKKDGVWHTLSITDTYQKG